MRSLSADALGQKEQLYNRPVELLRVFLDEETLYFAQFHQDLEFFDEQGNPQTYRAFNWSRGKINTNVDTKINSVDVSIANVSKEMASYVANTDFQGRRLQVLKVFLDADREIQNLTMTELGAFTQVADDVEFAGLEYEENAIIMFDGTMSAPSVNEQEISIKVTDRLDTLDKQLPRRTFSTQCNWQFGSEECGVAVPTKSSTIDSISSDYLTINDDAITESIGYWEHGNITIANETRLIEESGTGYIKVSYPFPADVSAGDNYSLEAGCDKSIGNGYKTGTVESISGNKLEDSKITEGAGYWAGGEVKVGNEQMKIIESGTGYIKAENNFANASAEDDYRIEAEIDPSKNIAHGCLFWDNFQFFGGFKNVPKVEDVRRVD